MMSITEELASGTAVLVDVRSPEEFAQKHFKDAQNIPIDKLEKGQFEIDKTQKIYLHCQKGPRADRAEEVLKAAGYTDVYNLRTMKAVSDLGVE